MDGALVPSIELISRPREIYTPVSVTGLGIDYVHGKLQL